MPVVMVPSNPNGLPIAMTRWPTRTSSEFASSTATSSDDGRLTLISARSENGSVPTISAVARTLSAKTTSISVAPSTTWLLVTIYCAAASTTNPEPCPPPGPACGSLISTWIETTAGFARSYRLMSNCSSLSKSCRARSATAVGVGCGGADTAAGCDFVGAVV